MSTTIALGLDVVDPTIATPMYDLYLDSTGQLVFHQTLNVVVAQAIVCRLRTMLGEWYQDPSIGIDYVGQVLTKGPNLATLQRYFAAQIALVPGVSSVVSVVCKLNSATRTLYVNFSAIATDGTAVQGSI